MARLVSMKLFAIIAIKASLFMMYFMEQGIYDVFHDDKNTFIKVLQYGYMNAVEGFQDGLQKAKAAVGTGATDMSWHGQSSFVFNDAAKRNITPGFVVDIGAHDGIYQSNSNYFLQQGYPGLLVEAMPETYAKLVANVGKYKKAQMRNVPVSLQDGKPINLIRTGWFNGTENRIGSCLDDNSGSCVKSVSLPKLLAENKVPKRSFLLSLDIEMGADEYLSMLESLKDSGRTFDYIVVENCQKPEKMASLGYTFLTQMGYDSVYRHMNL